MPKIKITGLSEKMHLEENREGKAYHFQLSEKPTDAWIARFTALVERDNEQHGRQAPQLKAEFAGEGPWLTLRDTNGPVIFHKLWKRLQSMIEATNQIVQSEEDLVVRAVQANRKHVQDLAESLGIPMVDGQPLDFASGVKP